MKIINTSSVFQYLSYLWNNTRKLSCENTIRVARCLGEPSPVLFLMFWGFYMGSGSKKKKGGQGSTKPTRRTGAVSLQWKQEHGSFVWSRTTTYQFHCQGHQMPSGARPPPSPPGDWEGRSDERPLPPSEHTVALARSPRLVARPAGKCSSYVGWTGARLSISIWLQRKGSTGSARPLESPPQVAGNSQIQSAAPPPPLYYTFMEMEISIWKCTHSQDLCN